MINEINCEFTDPINLGSLEMPDYEFSNLICTATNPAELFIENSTTGASFYLSQKLDYGDILLMILLTLIVMFGIFKFFWDLIIPKRVNFKK